jgi:hypothetical protein
MKFRQLASSVGLAAAIAFGASACDNPNATNNLVSVIADTLTVFALTGTPPSYPAAFLASSGAVTRADGSFNFDVAFDIDAANQVVVYPQKLVGVPCVVGALNCGGALGGKPVGLQRVTVAFDSLERAPAAGYQFDSTFTLAPGQALVMQVQSASECPLSFSTIMYSKFVVDSIDTGRRSVYFRSVNNPNCGYRSLVPGEKPKN